jgi:rubrerythrin
MGNDQEAIKQALQTEKNAMNFYQLAANQMKNREAKRMFEQLAKEEREHAEHFFKAYHGSDLGSFEEFIAAPPEYESAWVSSIQKVIHSDSTEHKALEIAMEKETNLEKSLLAAAAMINDPSIRRIFEQNATETHNHYLTIESEYSRLMAMVDESDVDTFVRE